MTACLASFAAVAASLSQDPRRRPRVLRLSPPKAPVTVSVLVTAAAFVLAACSLVPGVSDLGPVTASNHSGQVIVIQLATLTGGWTLAPGQRATLVASRTAAVNRAVMLSPTTCETYDETDLPAIGNVHLTIGTGPSFSSVENVDQPDIAPQIASPLNICPQ